MIWGLSIMVPVTTTCYMSILPLSASCGLQQIPDEMCDSNDGLSIEAAISCDGHMTYLVALKYKITGACCQEPAAIYIPASVLHGLQ